MKKKVHIAKVLARHFVPLAVAKDIDMTNYIAEAVGYRNLDRSTWGE
jgi:hypothetical protein